MSQFTYVVTVAANLDVVSILRSDGTCVPWANADFQLWNSAQQTPSALSTIQQQIQTVRSMNRQQRVAWWVAATPMQQATVIAIMIDLIPGVV